MTSKGTRRAGRRKKLAKNAVKRLGIDRDLKGLYWRTVIDNNHKNQ